MHAEGSYTVGTSGVLCMADWLETFPVTMHIHILHMWHSIRALFHNLLTSPKSLQMDTMLDVSAANSTDPSFCIVAQVGA